ncbi:MAG: membrane integrity-associated transporter subunit PqiC [Thiothrix sp.]|nr:membrane integrity-associated transporter subunit PqiC [Thiothrix sp.]HPE60987.1 PqiC family protein [Thiolinea sp.]
MDRNKARWRGRRPWYGLIRPGGLAGLLLLTACSGSVRTEYYTLAGSAGSVRERPALSARIPSLGVGPVYLPALLDRKSMVLRQDEYRVAVSGTHEWGGELEDEFAGALTDQLQARLPRTRMETVPWELEQTPRYQVTVKVSQFDGVPGQSATLRGNWQYQQGEDGKLLQNRRFDLKQATADDSVEALVRAQAALVGELADRMLDALE